MGRLATDTASKVRVPARVPTPGGPELSTAQLRQARSTSGLRRRPRSAWTDWRWTDRHARLAAHPLLAGASRREIRTLARYGDEVEVDAGVPLLSEDTIGKWFVLVLRGHLALTRGGQPVGMLGTGAWVGDEAILGFGPQPTSVTTASPCLLFVLGPRPVLSFAVDLPGLRGGICPSAGLGLALAIVDLVTPGELTAGKRVAVTGALDPEGRVGSVGGIPHKVRAAEAAGVDLLLVPEANLAEALAAANEVPVVAVASFSDAIAALVDIGGTGLIARVG